MTAVGEELSVVLACAAQRVVPGVVRSIRLEKKLATLTTRHCTSPTHLQVRLVVGGLIPAVGGDGGTEDRRDGREREGGGGEELEHGVCSVECRRKWLDAKSDCAQVSKGGKDRGGYIREGLLRGEVR